MKKDIRKEAERQEKKPYVEPKLEKAQKIESITQGVPPVVIS